MGRTLKETFHDVSRETSSIEGGSGGVFRPNWFRQFTPWDTPPSVYYITSSDNIGQEFFRSVSFKK